jgi:hypothetical protein
MNFPQKLNFSFRSLVSQDPKFWILYQPYILWGQTKRKAAGDDPNEGLILPDTELVIDGFQGSANSFATLAFLHCQTQPVKLSHHLHSSAQIIQAIQKDIPVLLTIRDPIHTVLSLTSRWLYISVSQGLRSYINFYTKLKPYQYGFIVSPFEETTQHLDQVIHTLNIKFQTNFDPVDIAFVNLECRKKISDSPERAAQRKLLKEQKQKELLTPQNQTLVSTAQALYRYYEECARRNFSNFT